MIESFKHRVEPSDDEGKEKGRQQPLQAIGERETRREFLGKLVGAGALASAASPGESRAPEMQRPPEILTDLLGHPQARVKSLERMAEDLHQKHKAAGAEILATLDFAKKSETLARAYQILQDARGVGVPVVLLKDQKVARDAPYLARLAAYQRASGEVGAREKLLDSALQSFKQSAEALEKDLSEAEKKMKEVRDQSVRQTFWDRGRNELVRYCGVMEVSLTQAMGHKACREDLLIWGTYGRLQGSSYATMRDGKLLSAAVDLYECHLREKQLLAGTAYTDPHRKEVSQTWRARQTLEAALNAKSKEFADASAAIKDDLWATLSPKEQFYFQADLDAGQIASFEPGIGALETAVAQKSQAAFDRAFSDYHALTIRWKREGDADTYLGHLATVALKAGISVRIPTMAGVAVNHTPKGMVLVVNGQAFELGTEPLEVRFQGRNWIYFRHGSNNVAVIGREEERYRVGLITGGEYREVFVPK